MNNAKTNSKRGCLSALRYKPSSRRAQSTIEFTIIVLFLLGVFLVFQKYIVRGISGRWKSVGDAMGQGKIYDVNYTTECEYHPELGWYDRVCFDNTCSTEGSPMHAIECIRVNCMGNLHCNNAPASLTAQ